MPVPNQFANVTTSIPLSQLDANFNTPITLGNTAIQLGNTVTTLNNMTLANVTISSGNVTITNVSVTTANVTTANITTAIIGTANVTTANVTTGIIGTANVTTGNITTAVITTANVATANITTSQILNYGTANSVVYLNSSKAATANTGLQFDGSNLGLSVTPNTWFSGTKALEIGATTALMDISGQTNLYQNAYLNAAGNLIYKTNNFATQYRSLNGQHQFFTAPSGTAGNAITFTQVMAVEGGKSLALEGATSQSGTGITFPATQSASTDANTLDDYEEGTWTPSGATGFPAGGQPSSITATYTKIGNMVSVRATFVGYNDGTSLLISGLPFTVSGNCAASISNSTPNAFSYERVEGTGFYCTISGTNASNKTWFLEATYRV